MLCAMRWLYPYVERVRDINVFGKRFIITFIARDGEVRPRSKCVAANISMTSPIWTPALDTRSTSISSPGTAVNTREAAYEGKVGFKPPELDFTSARLCNGEILPQR